MASIELGTPQQHDDGLRMGLFEHLDELRRRMFKAALALMAATGLAMLFTGELMLALQAPYGREFAVLGPTGGVVAYFRVALMAGAIIASPILTYQALMFVLPALKRGEKRIVLGALPAITGLFVLGTMFAWFVLIPPALGFLEGFQPTLFRPEWTADLYLGFVTTLIFWMGVAFELPLIAFLLSVLGMVTARALVRAWRIAIVGTCVAAALITPTVDPFNLALVAVPLLGLYVLSIGLAWVAGRLRREA
jgi:sec-independent protein translocase protein TatC